MERTLQLMSVHDGMDQAVGAAGHPREDHPRCHASRLYHAGHGGRATDETGGRAVRAVGLLAAGAEVDDAGALAQQHGGGHADSSCRVMAHAEAA